MGLDSARKPLKQSKLRLPPPPPHPILPSWCSCAWTCSSDIYPRLPFSFISCHVKSNPPLNVAPALAITSLYLLICPCDKYAVDYASAPHCVSETWCEAFLWLCQWHNHPVLAVLFTMMLPWWPWRWSCHLSHPSPWLDCWRYQSDIQEEKFCHSDCCSSHRLRFTLIENHFQKQFITRCHPALCYWVCNPSFRSLNHRAHLRMAEHNLKHSGISYGICVSFEFSSMFPLCLLSVVDWRMWMKRLRQNTASWGPCPTTLMWWSFTACSTSRTTYRGDSCGWCLRWALLDRTKCLLLAACRTMLASSTSVNVMAHITDRSDDVHIHDCFLRWMNEANNQSERHHHLIIASYLAATM